MNAVLYGICAGLITAIFLAILLGLVIFFVDINHTLADSLYIVLNYISVGIGAIVAGGKAGTKGWLFGGISGFAYIIIAYAGATLLFSIPSGVSILLVRAGMGGIVGIIGGIFGVNLSS